MVAKGEVARRHTRVDDTVAALRSFIRESEDDRLPTEVVLQSRLEVSRSTLREALARLEAMGEITRRGRSGTVINSFAERTRDDNQPLWYPAHLVLSLSEFLSGAGVSFLVRETRILRQTPPEETRLLLGLPPDVDVYVATRVYEIDGVVAAHLEHVLPTSLGGPPLQIQHLTDGIVTFLEDEGIRISHVEAKIAAEPLSDELAPALQLPAGWPILAMRTQIFGRDDSLLALGRLLFRSDRLSLAVSATGDWKLVGETSDSVKPEATADPDTAG